MYLNLCYNEEIILKQYYVAWEQQSHGKRLVGVFEDRVMAETWKRESSNRMVEPVASLDKTFAEMSVEYNRKYDG
ncbi:hypothetical protein VmeM32_00131 [Vibrio phage vB_VmeM-32]|nr:hypothetical protein VmeM32_00131 [Vibrio phage vB_VmeM-32]